MIRIRKSTERGHANHGWLDSFHTFSFAEYRDPAHMGFSVLRVINEDRIAGGEGFPTHPHRDMEIITYVVKGALEHKDSMGNSAVIRPGEVQRMSAGTGIQHSEFNSLRDSETHLLQIWIRPDAEGYAPGYEQKLFSAEFARGGLVLVASREARQGSIAIHQDADMYVARPKAGTDLTHTLRPGRNAWVQVVSGTISLNGESLAPGDGAAVTAVAELKFRAQADADFILFDLP